MRTLRAALSGLLAGLLVVSLAGCAAQPPITRLTFATTEAGVVTPRTLRRIVLGKSCFTRDFVTAILTPPWRAQRADHGLAIAAALDGVEGANILMNARIRVRIEQYFLFSRVCAIATGDAAVLE